VDTILLTSLLLVRFPNNEDSVEEGLMPRRPFYDNHNGPHQGLKILACL